MNAVNLLDLDGPGLDELVHSLGERTYRARQLKPPPMVLNGRVMDSDGPRDAAV